MKRVHSLVLAASLVAVGAAHAGPAASIFVTEPGGGNPFTIFTQSFNGSSYSISKLIFDFSPTHTTDGSHIVLGSAPFLINAPSGGTASLFGSGATFGFNFTSYDTGDVFSFSWDPDSAINTNYGATGLDFIGAKVTAITSGGTYAGVFEKVGSGPDVSAGLAPVPEPEAFAMAFGGLLTVGCILARRRRTPA